MNELDTYIIKRRAEGAPDVFITRELRTTGWPDSYIADAVARVNQHEQQSALEAEKPKPLIFMRGSFAAAASGLSLLLVIGLGVFSLSRIDRQAETLTASNQEQKVLSATEINQRNVRDEQRRADADRIRDAVADYALKNNGGQPPLTTERLTMLLDEKAPGAFKDPGFGKTYVFVSETPQVGEAYYASETICGEGGRVQPGEPFNFAVSIRLEADTAHCADNTE